jgi:hypothetical protein
LAKNWGKWDREKEALFLDLACRSAEEISSPSKKAEILEALAEAWKNLDQLRAKKILEGIDPDLIHTRKRLEEIRLWTKINPKKAQEWAEALPAIFHLERGWALKEVGTALKKEEPASAFFLLEKALMEALSLPPGNKRNKLLSNIIVEAALLDREKTIRKLRHMEDRETRDFLLLEAGDALSKVDPLWAVKATGEISESSIRCTLYREISEDLRTYFPHRKFDQPRSPPLLALYYLRIAREKAKSNKSHANPFYEKASQEIGKIVNRLEKSYLLCNLAAEWAECDEERALRVAEKISSKYPESSSYALLQVGIQLRKWNRKRAQSVFNNVLSLATKIPDHRLRLKRLQELGNQWQFLNKVKGKEILLQAKRDAEENLPIPGPGEKILMEVLIAQAQWELEETVAIVGNVEPPAIKAKILLESGKTLTNKEIEEDIKILNKTFEFAQASENSRLMSEIAVAWSALEPNKGLELIAQVGSKEIRIKGLRQMAHLARSQKKEVKHLLQQATKEAREIDELKEKVKALKEIANDWVMIDKEQAKSIYRTAYHMVEKAIF